MKTNVASYSYDITTNTLTVSADFAKRAQYARIPHREAVARGVCRTDYPAPNPQAYSRPSAYQVCGYGTVYEDVPNRRPLPVRVWQGQGTVEGPTEPV